MNTTNLLKKLRQFIEKGLGHRYNPQVGNVCFVSDNGLDKKEIFSNKSESQNLEIFIADNRTRFIQRTYRFPQSRFYLSTAENNQFKITCLDIFGKSIIVVKPFEITGDRIILKTESSSAKLCSNIPSKEMDSNVYEWNDLNQELIIYCGDETAKSLDNALTGFEKIYRNEVECHPLSQIHSIDMTMLREIDICWANLSGILEKRQLDTVEAKYGSEYLYWIQELYSYFGWFDELDQYYETNKESEKNINETKVRLDYIRSGKIPGSWAKTAETNAIRNLYQSPERFKSEEIHDLMTNYWLKICLPASNRYLAQLFKNKPSELLSFTLLSIKWNYWWVGSLIGLLHKYQDHYLSHILSPIWKLVISLHLHLQIWQSGQFSQVSIRTGLNSLRFNRPEIMLQKSAFGKLKTVRYENRFNLKLNKDVGISYDTVDKVIVVQPEMINLANPGLKFPKLRIKVDDHTLIMPLIWRQFFLEFNNVKFKFLLKKKRFQISIHSKSRQTELYLKNNKISFDNSLYVTVYHVIDSVSPGTEISLMNRYDVPVNKAGPFLPFIRMYGQAVDGHGLLRKKLTARINDWKHQTNIDLEKTVPAALSLPEKALSLHLHVPKGRDVQFNLAKHPGFFSSFLNSTADDLATKILVVIDQNDTSVINEIRRFFHEQLGIYPEVVFEDYKLLQGNRFVFYCTKTVIGKVILKRPLYSLRQHERGDNSSYIYVDPKNCIPFFANFFEMFLMEL